MGSGVSIESSSPEPEGNDLWEIAMAILRQRPLRLVQMLRLCRMINDSNVQEKIQLFEAGCITRIIEMLTFLHEHPKNSDEIGVKPGKKQKRPTSDHRRIRGIGYGSGSTKSRWNLEHTVESRLAREEQMVWLLNSLTAFLYKSTADYSDPDTILHKFKVNKGGGDFTAASPPAHVTQTTLEQVIEGSSLINIIRSSLVNDSLLDISHHLEFYQAILEVVQALTVHSSLLPQLMLTKDDEKNIIAMMRLFQQSLQGYRNKTGHISSPDFALVDFIVKVDLGMELLERANTLNRKSDRSASVPSIVRPQSHIPLTSTQSVVPVAGPQTGWSEGSVADKDQLYTSSLKQLQLTQHRFIGDFGKLNVEYSFRKDVRNINPFSPALKDRAKRIAKELACLPQSLPLTSSSSIFVCVDEGRCDIMKVLISGPSGTPYELGLFEFDLFFPANYPLSPPKVNFVTTGGGTVRFNPNLYPDGKVCLSILGTWEGRPEEKWSPHCTLLQLLVSIQALIFVHEPYYNEPGVERYLGGLTNISEYSKKYNLQIAHATLKWAIKEQLENPPIYFKDVINAHFGVLRSAVIEKANLWLKLCEFDIKTPKASAKEELDMLDYGPVFIPGMDKPLIDLIKFMLNFHHVKINEEERKAAESEEVPPGTPNANLI